MKIHLHKNATTTPAQRAFIQNNPHLSIAFLAEKTGVSKTTVRRWRNRSSIYDRPHTPKKVNTALTPQEEVQLILCRMATRAGLDDLHKIAGAFLDIRCSRASLNRCLKRYHISKLPALGHAVPFDLKDYTGTYLYYTCFHLPAFHGNSADLQLHALMDCTFRNLHAEITPSGHEFLSRHISRFPLRVLGIIYEEPVVLVPDDEADICHRHTLMVESRCRTHRIPAHHLDTRYTQTLVQLKKACNSLNTASHTSTWEFPWPSADAFSKDVARYNKQFSLSALRQQTPTQAMESHYTHFPSSFRAKPRAWA